MTQNGITADDLLKFSFLQDPQLSPDGNWLVYVKRSINEEKKYQSSLYMMDLQTKEEFPFTKKDDKAVQPRFSPEGHTILFTSNRSGTQQIWKIASNGGEAEQLTYFKNGAADPIWSPDGKQVLCTVPLAENEVLLTEDDSEDDSKEAKPYVTSRLKYKADGEGLLNETHKHLILIDLDSGKGTKLTTGSYDHQQATFSPDGKRIAFVANRSKDPDYELISDIYELTLEDNQFTKLTDSDGVFTYPNYSPDGTTLSLLGHRREYKGATLTRVWTLDRATGNLTCLTGDWDVEANDVAINDMGTGVQGKGAVWSTENDALYVQASEKGYTNLYHVSLNKRIKTIVSGKRQIYAFSLDQQQKTAVIGVSDHETPGDFSLVSMADGKEEKLTYANQEWLQEKVLSVPEEINFEARDGSKLHGWVMKPIGYQEGTKYPLIVEIHGGPHAMYSHAFMHEFQVLAEKGYGVLYINPRGSHGYGQAFVDAVRGDYGGNDYHDIMDAVDYATKTCDWIDKDRLGVTGGSYGGFMTNWIVGHTNRFKAAVTQRSITNWLSFYGVSDIGYFFTEWELKADLIQDPDTLWKHSPLRYVKNVETPLLILHSEKDHRCPIEQGEQFYVALKQQQKPTRLVRFPEANHNLSRSGDPSLRISRLNEMIEWFEQYL
ncbi:S9 family peptidase [Salinibacillus xinjiangensis]|uniref:Prolyl oligopeptidase family serine peptidase n=1 Tax=Salinibacillus xinjiangensis TaxID=1229268 RepID=A0A6G1XA28_9BACI|nr:S9 family peptidase [Salinibacillus xinjiangensis]MRG87871.1 prolyl oligopeptidase family serine peptidase [Salinibacillus xinjiangensis]